MDDKEEIERLLASFFSGNRQPCMSGDPRDRCNSFQRRDLSDAATTLIEAGFHKHEDKWLIAELRNQCHQLRRALEWSEGMRAAK